MGMVTASEAAAVLGLSPYESALDVYLRKIGTVEPQKDAELLRHGHGLETYIGQCFTEATQIPLTPRQELIQSEWFPCLGCTLDFATPKGIPVDAKAVGVLGRWEEIGVPRWIWIQLQAQCVVTAQDHAYVALLAGGFQGMAFRWAKVDRDDDFIVGDLLPACEALMRNVTDGVPPDPDGSYAASHALARLYPNTEPEKVVELGGGLIEADAVFKAAAQRESAAKATADLVRNKIRAAIGDAEAGILPNGVRWTWKKNRRGVRSLRRAEPKT